MGFFMLYNQLCWISIAIITTVTRGSIMRNITPENQAEAKCILKEWKGEYCVFQKGLNPRRGDEVVHLDKTQTATLKKWSGRVNYTGIITSIYRAPES